MMCLNCDRHPSAVYATCAACDVVLARRFEVEVPRVSDVEWSDFMLQLDRLLCRGGAGLCCRFDKETS